MKSPVILLPGDIHSSHCAVSPRLFEHTYKFVYHFPNRAMPPMLL